MTSLIMFVRMRKGMSKSTQGKLFENMTRNALNIIRTAENGDFWYQRIWDYKTYVSINPNLFCFKQVGDFMACHNGQFYIIECKSSVRDRYDFKNVKEHQEEAMRVIERAAGVYWLLILHRSREDRQHELYALRPERWLRVKKLSGGYVSASWQTINALANFKLERKGGVWDLSPLFKVMRQPVRMRKCAKTIRLTKRDISFIFSREFPAVALYDPETDDISILVDIWTKICWKKWADNFAKFSQFLMEDLNISLVHELIHWATEPIELEGSAVTRWEGVVERISKEITLDMPITRASVIELEDNSNTEEIERWFEREFKRSR